MGRISNPFGLVLSFSISARSLRLGVGLGRGRITKLFLFFSTDRIGMGLESGLGVQFRV